MDAGEQSTYGKVVRCWTDALQFCKIGQAAAEVRRGYDAQPPQDTRTRPPLTFDETIALNSNNQWLLRQHRGARVCCGVQHRPG